MKKFWLLTWLILTSGLLLFYSCRSTKDVLHPKDLSYIGVKNFSLQKMSLSKPQVGVELQFFNPNSFGLAMKDADIDIFINNNFIGKVTTDKTFTIPARDTFLLPISLEVEMKKVIPNAIEILTKKTIDYRLQGSVKAGKGIFVRVPVDYSGQHKIEF
jgi:LEA14-like dessication related protein